MSFAPYLSFDGTCEPAMQFYASVFGATDLQLMRYSDAPPGTFPDGVAVDRILHAQFTLGSVPLLASDVPPGMPVVQSGVSVFHAAATDALALDIFAKLADGGSISMQYGPTFWGPGFGMVTDRFGTHWMISVAPST